MGLFKIKNLWMGPDEKVVNEGFDDLFQVEDNYKIPPPGPEVKRKLTNMAYTDTNKKEEGFTKMQGFEMAMDTVFGKKSKSDALHLEQMEQAPMSMARPAPLQPGAGQLNIVVVEPRSFGDSLEIVNHLKDRKSVIVNLQYLDRDVSQRVIDFVSGATLALDGTQERVGHGVFIFASMNTQVETESEGVRAYKDLFAKTFG
jgi:FtsZ-interacting cell division protein YlmF